MRKPILIATALSLAALLTGALVLMPAKVNCVLPTKRVDGTPLKPGEIAWVNWWTVRLSGTKNSRMISWKGSCGTYNGFVQGQRYAATVTLTDKTESALSNVIVFQR